ncbi:MAG: hypothetical protein F4018_02395 [Acidobacteria bacterium]|nr:hypothetical protein [Acidobacteriota bacterium]MYH29554.1 hypothetical protein [Acidobacteriota bacterium]MYK87273.1 hypothetical protein [Acidobacteriota bacterium]
MPIADQVGKQRGRGGRHRSISIAGGRPTAFGAILLALLAAPAGGQTPADERWRALESAAAPGEDYTIELAAGLWDPTAAISGSTEVLGIRGGPIDFNGDLGLRRKRHSGFRLTLKAGRRHKLRASLIPMQYRQQQVLERRVVFRGTRLDVGLPVDSTFRWDAWRFGYELDVATGGRGYLGLILEAKYTHLYTALDSNGASAFVETRAPVPAIGGIARFYVTRLTPVTVEATGFVLPEDTLDGYHGRYVDLDVYATLNLSRHLGLSIGYRTLDVSYLIDRQTGDYRLGGVYASAALRY